MSLREAGVTVLEMPLRLPPGLGKVPECPSARKDRPTTGLQRVSQGRVVPGIPPFRTQQPLRARSPSLPVRLSETQDLHAPTYATATAVGTLWGSPGSRGSTLTPPLPLQLQSRRWGSDKWRRLLLILPRPSYCSGVGQFLSVGWVKIRALPTIDALGTDAIS